MLGVKINSEVLGFTVMFLELSFAACKMRNTLFNNTCRQQDCLQLGFMVHVAASSFVVYLNCCFKVVLRLFVFLALQPDSKVYDLQRNKSKHI